VAWLANQPNQNDLSEQPTNLIWLKKCSNQTLLFP